MPSRGYAPKELTCFNPFPSFIKVLHPLPTHTPLFVFHRLIGRSSFSWWRSWMLPRQHKGLPCSKRARIFPVQWESVEWWDSQARFLWSMSPQKCWVEDVAHVSKTEGQTMNYDMGVFFETISYNYTTLWIILQQCSFGSRRKKLNNNRHTVMEATKGPFLTAEAQWFPKSKFYIHCSHSRNSPSTPQTRQIPIFESWSIGYLGGSCWHAGIPDLSLSMHPGYCMIASMTLGGQSKVSKGRKSCFSVGLAGMACRIHSGHLYLGLIELVAICMGASHGWFCSSVQVNRAWLRCWRCVQNTSRIFSGWQVEGHSGKGRWFLMAV